MYEFEKNIKRCPFCGSTAKLIETDLVSVAKCTNCGAEGPRCVKNWGKPERAAYAVASWNLREPEPSTGSGPLFCRLNDQLGTLMRISNILQGAPDLVVVEHVLEHMDDVAPATRYYISELVNRFRRKDLILKDICKALAVNPDPAVPPESR